MTSRPAGADEIRAAMEEFATNGLDGLQPPQKRLLARVLVDEARKGAFNPVGELADVTLRYIAHVRAAFGDDAEYRVVRDHRAQLRRHAEAMAAEHPAVTSLILYATAIEHWLNALIVTASLKHGLTDLDAGVVVRKYGPLDKLDWLHQRFHLERVAGERLAAVRELFDVRNAYVHYKWKGVTETELAAMDNRIQRIVQGAGDLLDYLEA